MRIDAIGGGYGVVRRGELWLVVGNMGAWHWMVMDRYPTREQAVKAALGLAQCEAADRAAVARGNLEVE